jgi:hypothetical protein
MDGVGGRSQYLSELLQEHQKLVPFSQVLPICNKLLSQGETLDSLLGRRRRRRHARHSLGLDWNFSFADSPWPDCSLCLMQTCSLTLFCHKKTVFFCFCHT